MHTTIRIYKGATELNKALVQRRSEIEKLIKNVPGFRTYQLIDTHDGVASVTTCDDKSGCEKSNQVAADFIRTNLSSLKGTKPDVFDGDVTFSFGETPATTGTHR
jgi:hypothetical protein